MKLFRILAGVAVAGALLIPAAPASAAVPPNTHPVTSSCAPLRVFYGNPDEKPLVDAVKSTPFGFEFVGPSLVHHEMAATALSALPTTASIEQTVSLGNPMLFKLESSIPGVAGTYSTINLNTYGPNAGKWWSSKIAAGPGSQNEPVAGPADLVGLWTGFTTDTRVFSWGFGYANDAGNKSMVKSVTWMGKTTRLQCIVGSPGPSNGPVTKPPTKVVPKPGPKKTNTPATLPQTPGASSNKLMILGGIGGGFIAFGFAALIVVKLTPSR